MLERLGGNARRSVERARDEASRLGHDHVGTEHLLLGLVATSGTAASGALTAAGASVASVREKVVEALASRSTGGAGPTGRELAFTDRANRALDRANRLSLRAGMDEVQPEHILLALLTVEGTAGQVLRGLAVDPEAVKAALAQSAESEDGAVGQAEGPHAVEVPDAESGHRGVVGPLCASCGAELAGSLDHVRLPVGSGRAASEVDVFYCTVCGSAIGARLA